MGPFALDFITDNPLDDDLVCSMSGRKESILGSPVKGCLCHPCPVEERMLILCLDSDEVGEVEVEVEREGKGGRERRERRWGGGEGGVTVDGRAESGSSTCWLEVASKDGASNKFHKLLPSLPTSINFLLASFLYLL